MAQQRRGLGKGLGALIPETPRPGGADAPQPADTPGPADSSGATATATTGAVSPESASGVTAGSGTSAPVAPEPTLNQVDGAYFEEVAIDAISPNPRQPRRTFDEEALEELSASITEVGLLQPVVVRKLEDGKYELVMGERRWRASTQAGLEKIPAIVRETQDTDMLRDALLENLHRQQLDPLEEAAAYQQLLDDFGATHEQLSQRIGRSRPHITNTLRLLNLPPAVQKKVAAGVISAGHARALLGLSDPQAQERLAQRIVSEGLSVRTVEEIVKIGDDTPTKSPRRPNASKPVNEAMRRLAGRLSDVFDTKVKVELGRNKGKITLEFANVGDLDRIVKAMSPEAAGVSEKQEAD